jgi:class 3 adenylate cyclase
MPILDRLAIWRLFGPPKDRHQLLEPEIETILKFPDQNPNPVLRTSPQGRLLYANPGSEPITRALDLAVGRYLPGEVFRQLLAGAQAEPPRSVDLRCGLQTFAVLAVHVPELDVYNLYGTDVTAAKVIEMFPDENPNPVFRMGPAGVLIYANPAGAPITASLGVSVGETLPIELRDAIRRRLAGESTETIEVRGMGRTYALTPVPIREFGFVNVYGTDVTALHAIDKFPNENPNPVLRISRQGDITYANPASALVRKALGAEVGEQVSREQWERLAAAADRTGPDTIEVQADGRIFSLKVVSLFEFDSINVYGTDITAAREVERFSAENERLLLNILPPTIADRLEEMTVLFADVVGFTPFASGLAAADVVEVLNGVFSLFDRLAERHGLEKIKTIGDAYMVVGGLAEDPRQPERVAQMGLDMIRELAGYRTASGRQFEIKVGMHVGPVIGGVIGLKKFIYDIWGDTVNTASRMESQGVPGRVQVTEAAHERLKDAYTFEPRGSVEIKGKGPMQTYLLVGPRK